MNKKFIFAIFAIITPAAWADQGSFTNSGGSTSGGTVIISNVASPAGTLTISGNSLTFFLTDGATAISATLTSVTSTESCSGGGKGGRVTCGYSYTGYFSGFTLQNAGTGPLQVTTVTVSGPFSQTNTCAASIAPGGSCTVSIMFTPTAVGSGRRNSRD